MAKKRNIPNRGRIQQKAEVWEVQTVADGFGGEVANDVLIGSFFCELLPNSQRGLENLQSGSIEFSDTFNFLFRKTSVNITPEINFILYKGVKYVVNSVRDEDLKGQFLRVVCNSEQ